MTKLHKTATALLLTAAMLLGGCAEQKPDPAPGAETSTSSDVSSSNSSESTENSTSNDNSGSSTDPKINPDIEKFPIENITMPDGSVVSKYEAVDGYESWLNFDFSYVHYKNKEEQLRTSFDDPSLLDIETFMEISKDFHDDPSMYVKVKAGDKLENGLVVRSATSHFVFDKSEFGTYLNKAEIEFEGRLTLSGILYYSADYDRYGDEGLFFLGDPSRSDPLPLPDRAGVGGFSDNGWTFASINNCPIVHLGSINDLPGDFSDIIAPGEIAEVKITVEDISEILYIPGGPISPMVYFTIVSAEPL